MAAVTDLPDEDIRQRSSLASLPFPVKVANFLYNTLTDSTKVRSPPENAAEDVEHIKLVTIGVSHYCEKARWGLDLLEDQDEKVFYYTEEAHPPLFHVFSTVPQSTCGKSMTPMTIPTTKSCRTNEPLHDSTAILKQYCPFLYPTEHITEIDEIEAEIDQVVGPTVRLLAYYNYLMLPDDNGDGGASYESSLVATACKNTSKIEASLFEKMFDKGIKEGILKAMKVNATKASNSETALRQIVEKYSSKLSDRRPYLVGNQFTAADLTLAALLAPLLSPPELDELRESPTKSETPPGLEQLKQEFRDTPAGRHVLKMYRYHRFSLASTDKAADLNETSPTRQVQLKIVPRDRTITEAILSNSLIVTGSVTAAAIALIASLHSTFASSKVVQSSD